MALGLLQKGPQRAFWALSHCEDTEPVIAPVSGIVMWEVDFNDKSIAPAPGKVYKEGDLLCAINSEPGMDLQFPCQIISQ